MNVKKSILSVGAAIFGLLNSCVGTGDVHAVGQNGSQAEEQAPLSVVASVSPVYGHTVRQGDVQKIAFTLKDGARIDSAVLSIGERRIAAVDTAGYEYVVADDHPVGRLIYRLTAYLDGQSESRSGEFTVLAAQAPVLYGHRVVATYPHDRRHYTQGLLWHDGYLYESTGLEGHSALFKIDPASGRALKTERLDRELFGEGLALLDGKFYLLTWQNNRALVYDAETFEKTGEFGYAGEGWGLATDGRYLYMSDGSEKIHVIDPDGFRRLRTIEVYTDRSKVPYINEMEWIDGELWANVYMTDTIVRIDPRTGVVTGVVDMGGLLSEADVDSTTDVLNGIAYDARGGRIFVTGKNWNKLFEVSIVKE